MPNAYFISPKDFRYAVMPKKLQTFQEFPEEIAGFLSFISGNLAIILEPEKLESLSRALKTRKIAWNPTKH